MNLKLLNGYNKGLHRTFQSHKRFAINPSSSFPLSTVISAVLAPGTYKTALSYP